jgi:hypothetical protein
MNTSASVQDLITALVKARAAFPAILKNRKVTVSTSHGKYDFEYADLSRILEAVVGPLAEHGLVIVNSVDASDTGGVRVTTSLSHVSGQWMATTLSAGPCQDIQKYGSALSYLRRYGICALLGIAGESDDDGNQTVGNAVLPRHASTPSAANGDVPNNRYESITVKNPPVTSPHGAAHPTLEQIDQLFALAESCQEPKEIFGTTLRRIIGLGDEVRISKKFLRENLDMKLFEMARTHYEQMLRRQIEDDVPDGTPPGTGDVSTPVPDAEVGL